MRELIYGVVGYIVIVAILLTLKHYDLLPSDLPRDIVDRMYPEYEECIRKRELYESRGKELDLDCYEKIEIFEDFVDSFFEADHEYIQY